MSLLTPITQDPAFSWNERSARHLLNRAGFGIPYNAVQRLAALSPEVAVGSFVDFQNLPDVCPEPPALPERVPYRQIARENKDKTEEELRKLRNERRRAEKEAMLDLQVWWLNRMCRTQRPLQEKMALFWHGHFATSAEKVQEPQANLELNEIFRNLGTGNFRDLTLAVGKSDAMLRYLDQQKSTREKPNENWARELMELFTLGIGNYTEDDIKNAARAFTGWTTNEGEFRFAYGRHDRGPKTILGATAPFDGDAVVNHLVAQPACSRFICKKLWTYFAYENPEPEIVEGLARTFRTQNYNLKPVLRQMFLSRAFYQDKAYFAQIKSPAQLAAGVMVQLGADDEKDIAHVAVLAMRAMGQSLFYPPNVKGWDGGRAWINTNTLLVRYNFSNFLVSGIVPDLQGEGANNVRRQFLQAALGRTPRISQRGADADNDAMMSGDSMMAPQDNMSAGATMEAEVPDAPAGQDAMPRDIPAQTFYNKLRQRRDDRKKLAGMTKEERREYMMTENAMKVAPFNAREFFAGFKGQTGEQIIAGLSKYFIGFDLDNQQREKLTTVLAQAVEPTAPVPVDRMAEEDLRATVQLMLSTVEYQVC